jgi:hypothetical protein
MKNGMVVLGRKGLLIKKRADSHLGDDVRLRKKKLNAHGREKTCLVG